MNTHLLTTLNVHLRFHDLPGPGIPLVFIHGLGCASSCDYPRVVFDPALSSRRFLLVDLLGSGFSDRPSHFSYSVDDHAHCILDLLSALNTPTVDLYGHSMGGTIAIVAAALQPNRIRRLIVSEPTLDPSIGVFSRSIAAQSESDYVAYSHEDAIRSAIQSGNHVWAGSMAASAPIAIHREARSLVRGGTPSWRDQLLSLSMPRTVVFGEHSLPHPDTKSLAKAGLTIDVVSNAEHSMMWENPSGLANAIQRALA